MRDTLGRSQLTSSAALRDPDRRYFGSGIRSINQFGDAGSIGAVSAHDPNELLNVVTAESPNRLTSAFVEPRRTPLIEGLAAVVKLVLDQSHKLGVAAFEAVGSVEGKQERRHQAEP